MRFLSLFAGIGGFDLGLERAGMTCVGQVEIDDYCTAILAKHWPDVPRWGDIRDVDVQELISKCGSIDLICGGFPCQDISVAGKGAGIEGARSGLWWEMWRIIQGIKPRWLFIENVPAFRTRGADIVLPLLAKHSYTVEPSVVGVRHLGGSHKRDRISIVAYRDGDGLNGIGIGEVLHGERETSGDDVDGRCSAESMGDTNGDTIRKQSGRGRWTERTEGDRGKEIAAAPPTVKGGSSNLADSNREHGTTSTVERRREVVATSEISAESGSDSQLANTELPGRRAGDGIEGNQSKERFRRDQSSNRYLWPAGPGEQQYDWEEPRTIKSTLDPFPYGLSLYLVGLNNAATLKRNIPKTVPSMWRVLQSKTIQWKVGRLPKFRPEKVLFNSMFSAIQQFQRNQNKGLVSPERKKVPESVLRVLQILEKACDSSCGSELQEQCTRELANALQKLPRPLALACKKGWNRYRRARSNSIKLALRGIGNAFCPYQAEIYGRSIMRIDKLLSEEHF